MKIIFCYFMIHASQTLAQDTNTSVADDIGLVYYDGDNIIYNKKDESIVIDGNVLFYLSGTFISAQRVSYLKQKGLLTAEGDVRIIRNKEKMTGSSAIFDQTNREFRIDNVEVIADSKSQVEALNEEVLGFSLAELAFEISRSEREQEQTTNLKSLRDRFVNLNNGQIESFPTESENIKNEYARVLERLSRTRFQPNEILGRMSDTDRTRLERRRKTVREFLERDTKGYKASVGFGDTQGYVRLRAKQLYQTSSGNYVIDQAELTPCRCDDKSVALWGLSAKTGIVEPEKYVTLNGASVDILNIPVLYAPFIKFPIKSKRESGLLLPSYYVSRSGEVATIPLFIAIGEHADVTITYDEFTSRGSRFGLESRIQVTDDSQIRTFAEFIRDRKFQKNLANKSDEIEAKIISNRAERAAKGELPDDAQEQELRSQTSDDSSNRWFAQGSWNIPIAQKLSLKTDGEFVSDNLYVADFSKDFSGLQDILAPQQNTRRFLTQDAAAEFYGDDFTLSARLQGARDVFVKDGPKRLPRLEASVLPKSYFGTPIVLGADIQWEKLSHKSNPGALVQGDRMSLHSKITYPWPENSYVNADFSVSGKLTQLVQATTQGTQAVSTQQSSLIFESNLSVPFVAQNFASFGGKNFDISNQFSPKFTLQQIPTADRGQDFPLAYQLFYAEDAVHPKQIFRVGVSGSLSVAASTFVPKPISLQRLPADKDIKTADFDLLGGQIGASIESLTPESLFQLSAQPNGFALFQKWAGEELRLYLEAVRAHEGKNIFMWPPSESLQSSQSWTATPLSWSLLSSYNFQSTRTNASILANRRPGTPRQRLTPWEPMEGRMDASLNPILPIGFGLTGTYDPVSKRFLNSSYGFKTGSIAGLGFEFTNAVERTIAGTEEEPLFPEKRSITVLGTYRPLSWLLLSYRRKSISSFNAQGKVEAQTENQQTIEFTGLQECLDITVSRWKPLIENERNASWAIGLNLRFLSYQRDFGNIGDSLDRVVKAKLRKPVESD